MASIQRIKSPLTREISYRAQVRVKGSPSQSKTFSSRAAASKWSKSIESAVSEGRYFPTARASRTDFAEAVQRYRDSVLAEVKARSRHTRDQHLNFFLEQFKGMTLAQVTADRVAEARDGLASTKYSRGKAKKTRAGGTVNRYLATLSHLFTVAQREWRLVDRNPVKEVSRKKESKGRVRFLSDDEREALLTACEGSGWKPLKALVVLAISTGARRGELLALTWDRVDLKVDAKKGKKDEPKSGRAHVFETKSGEPRVLPLVGQALEALRELKLQNSSRSAFVFPHPNGRPEAFYWFDSYWIEAVKAAGIENFRFHDLRHTCASYLAQRGASTLEIADVLGHKSLSMVRRYSHLAVDSKSTLMEKMAREKGL
jgi:integrase